MTLVSCWEDSGGKILFPFSMLDLTRRQSTNACLIGFYYRLQYSHALIRPSTCTSRICMVGKEYTMSINVQFPREMFSWSVQVRKHSVRCRCLHAIVSKRECPSEYNFRKVFVEINDCNITNLLITFNYCTQKIVIKMIISYSNARVRLNENAEKIRDVNRWKVKKDTFGSSILL